MPGASPTTRRVPVVTPFGRRVRLRDVWRGPFLAAVLHLFIILALIWAGQRAVEALRAPGEGDGQGGGGGGGGNRTFAVLLPGAALAEPVPVVEEPVPPPEVLQLPTTPVVAPQAPVESTVVAAAAATASGPGTGAGTGPGAEGGSGGGSGGGVGTGAGTGTGPDSGGAGGRVFPPQPQGILIPPTNPPRELKGVTITVRFDIGVRGDVLGVEVVEPPIRNRGYRNEFLDRMRGYTFAPARTRDGRAVRALFDIQFTL